jgi:hypothetical protein
MKNGLWQSHGVKKHALPCQKGLLAFICVLMVLLPVAVPTGAAADDLGEHILAAILRNEKPSDAALLLLTRDLKWYEQNMGRLKPEIQNRVQQLRVNVAGRSSQMAARSLNEAGAVFAATGSWKPGRDMDIIYFGKNGDHAAARISESYEVVTGQILKSAEDDPILQSFRRTGGAIPSSLPTECLAVCTTELPDYGYSDLEKAYKKAKEALARGEPRDEILKTFRNETRAAMESNVKAHFAAMSNPDYYAGATGQEWFRKTYLNDTEKMRVFAQNADGDWALQPGGIKAVPEEIVERLGFGSFGPAGQVKFSKIASDYALFFSHMHGGPSDNAKYAMRVWTDMGLNAIQNLSDGELKILTTAKIISKNPNRAAQILSEMGIGVDEFNAGIVRILHGWTESQLVLNMERIVAELSASSGKSIDELEKLLRQSKASMELNEIVAGLSKLSAAPNGKAIQTQLLERLQAKFGNTESGKAAISLILKNLGLLGDSGELTARIVRILARAGKITDAEAAAFQAGGPLSGRAQAQVNQVKKELLALNAGGMVEFDSTLDLEQLMNDWRKSQPDAILQNVDDDIRTIIAELHDAPDTQLKGLGWTAEEIALQDRLRRQLRANKQMMPSLGSRLQKRLAKAGIKLSDVRADIRKMMFNPEYTKLGDPSMSVGAFDAIVGTAGALFQTYTILNGPAMKEEDETIALSNAWVTAIPVVGDFAQSLITGSEGYWEGDKGKMVDAGLWMAIGVTGLIPGGQLPAVIASITLAAKPAAQGIYEARQAQNLVQAWVESGKWSSGKPPVLEGIYDRNGLLHRLNYEEILGTKGEVKYDSTRIKSLPFGEFTIAQSVRDYANRYVLAGNKNVDVLRENLKTLFPDLGDNVLNDLEYAEIKLGEKKSKLATMFFKAYERQVRGAYIQTIAHLKKWAEDERRVAKDYEGEIARLRTELAALEKELKNASLVKHADETVNSYTKIATNLFEQESLPLSKVRIYENYIATYKQIRDKLKSVSQIFTEASSHFVPTSWFLTGYPTFDKDITDRLVKLMGAERTRAEQQVVQLLKDLNQKDTHLNLQNECHKKAFDIIAAQRYQIAFTQHLSEYYRALAGASSSWNDSYESAKASYDSTRDRLLKMGAPADVVQDNAYMDAFTTFFFAMGFAIASKDADAYRQLGDEYEARLVALREHDKSDRMAGTESDAGKALQQCLKTGLQLEIQLSTTEPKVGTDVDAVVKLTKGTLPKETSWAWVTNGGLTAKPRFGERTVVKVASEGELTVRLMDERYTNRSIAEAKVKIVPKTDDAAEKQKEKERLEKERAEKERAEKEKSEREKTENEKAKQLPACSYKYSDWGECSRATKKQTRTVIAKEPAGCIEKGKPELEKACTPASRAFGSLTEDERIKLLNCICWCSSSLYTGHYHPDDVKGQSPSCDNRANGPCMGGEWGCFRFFMKSSGECVQNCYKSQNVIFDEASSKKVSDEVNKKFMNPLKVELKADKASLQLGDTANISAVASGGIPAYHYTWSHDPKADKNSIQFVSSLTPGTYSVSVTVRDDGDNSASATLQLTVEALTVRIEKLEPKEDSLPVGGSAKFMATVLSGNKPATGSYVIRWQPHPEVEFNPFEKSANTTARFTRLGTYKVWANVLLKQGEILSTVGESEQIAIEVVRPRLTLQAVPQRPYVGQEVKITVAEQPKMDDKTISFRWEIAGNALNPGPLQNNREYTFRPKDVRPIRVTVYAKAKDGGDDLGQEQVEIGAQTYEVKVSEPRLMGPKPRVWKEGVGLVEVERGIAVFQDVTVRAEVSPAPEKPPLSYSWSIEPSGCGMPGAGQEIRVNCSQVGTYEAKVLVKDSQGVELGSGSGQISVTVSQEEINRAGKAKEASEKVAKAKELVSQGKLDEAIAAADEASKLNPKNTEASALANKLKSQKTAVSRQLDRVKKLIEESKFPEAQKELAVAKEFHGKYPPVVETEKLLNEKLADYNKKQKEFGDKTGQAQRLKTEGEALEKQGKLQEAAAKYRDSIKLVPDAKVEEKIRSLEDRITGEKATKQTADRLWDEGKKFQQQSKESGALAKYKESLKLWASPEREKTVKDLEGQITQKPLKAQRLKTEGTTLESQGKLKEAIDKYRESLRYLPDKNLEDRIASLEGQLRSIQEKEAKEAQAKKLKAEGEALEKQGKLKEALSKYRESLNVTSDPKLEQQVRNLENRIAQEKDKEKKQEIPTKPATPSPPTPPRPATEEEIKYVKGFVGKWNTTFKQLEFSVSGNKVTGHYSYENGRIEATLSADGKTMEGVWMEEPSYKPPRDAGRVIFRLSQDGKTISGQWWYGQDGKGGDWTGTRIMETDSKKDRASQPEAAGKKMEDKLGVNSIVGEWKLFTGHRVGTAKEKTAAYTGSLVFTLTSGKLAGKLMLHSYWEELKNVSFANGIISFDRPIPGLVQHYQGRLVEPKKIEGTFTHKEFTQGWWAQKP